MEVAESTSIRVPTLASSKIISVPPQYIQPSDHLPCFTATTIPLIDLSLFSATDFSGVCCEWGAFHVINHGVPSKLLDEMRTVGLSFFSDLDVSEKLRYSCDTSSAATEEYGSKMLVSKSDGAVLDSRNYFDHHTFPLSRWKTSIWPDYPPNHRTSTGRKVVEEYSVHMKMLAQKLLSLISESLGLQPSCIEDAVGEFYQNITVSYYPPCPQAELTLGLESHSDMGVITLLIQDDVGGLEVLNDGEWVNVQPLSDAIVVILADQIEVITNGKYKGAIHQVITNANRARFSVATFHEPYKTRTIAPTPELVAKSGPHFPEFLYGDFVEACYSKVPERKRAIDVLRL